MRGFLEKEIKSNAGRVVIKSYTHTLLVAFVNSYNVFESHGKVLIQAQILGVPYESSFLQIQSLGESSLGSPPRARLSRGLSSCPLPSSMAPMKTSHRAGAPSARSLWQLRKQPKLRIAGSRLLKGLRILKRSQVLSL